MKHQVLLPNLFRTVPMRLPPSINLHLLKACNASCSFCFAPFHDVRGQLSFDELRSLIFDLQKAGVQKLTFAGGEPTLHPQIGRLIEYAKARDLVTCVVTNGAKLDQLLDSHASVLDWVGLSIDSASDETERILGRGPHGYIADRIRQADQCRRKGVRIKLNTVVTTLSVNENMNSLVQRIAPERWKIFQVLPVAGQNDGVVESLLITDSQFRSFVHRHRPLETIGITVVPESNTTMTGSYAMVDPLGRFFDNTDGRHRYSSPILEVGVSAAWSQVRFVPARFKERGGLYPW
jgi:radical S-adenosyl methionine domain-containing protein 2